MNMRKRVFCLIMTVILAVNIGAAYADDAQILSADQLAEAWAITGLDDNAAAYREGMAFSGQMNASQMAQWLDEMLKDEMTALQHIHSQMETALAEMKTDNPDQYASLTSGNNETHYRQLQEKYNQAENLRQRIRWCRDMLQQKSSVIAPRKSIIGNSEYSRSEQLTASREIEEALDTIREIRSELAQNADTWMQNAKNWYAAMTGGPSANGLGEEAFSAWVDAVVAADTKAPLNGSVAADSLHDRTSSGVLSNRLAPRTSILGDASETVTVTVVDKESICFVVTNDEDGTPLADATVTVTDMDNPTFSETLKTAETGAVITNANKYTPDEYANLNLLIQVDLDGHRSFLTENVQMQKGESLTNTMTQDDGQPYVYSASFNSHDILKSQYSAFFSKKNDKSFPIRVVTDRACDITLIYTGADGQEHRVTLSASPCSGDTPEYRGKYEAVFQDTWKSIIKPESTVSVSLKTADGKTSDQPLMLKLVASFRDEPLTSLGDFLGEFAKIGAAGVEIPGKYFGPLGGMSLNAQLPWEKYFTIRASGNIDGSFVLLMGGEFSKLQNIIDGLLDNWKSSDQKELDTRMNDVEEEGFARQNAMDNEITSMMNDSQSKKHPLLSSFTADLTLFALFTGEYQKAGDDSEFVGRASIGAMLTFGFNLKYYFFSPPPIYLDLSVTASLSVGFCFTFEKHKDEGKTVQFHFDGYSSGLSISLRITVTLGVSLGIKGVFTATIGGYFFIALSVNFTMDENKKIHTDFYIDLGGGIFVEVTFLWFQWHWNIYDSGAIRIYPKPDSAQNGSNELPWYPDVLASEAANGDAPEEKAHTLTPDSYDALELQVKTEIDSLSVGSANIRFAKINGDTWMFYLTAESADKPTQLAARNMRTGTTRTLSEGTKSVYSFDVQTQKPRQEIPREINDYWADHDFAAVAWASASGFTEKETGKEGKTVKVPNDTELFCFVFTTENGDTIIRDLPAKGDNKIQAAYSAVTDCPLGNIQIGIDQPDSENDDYLHCTVLADDAIGDKAGADVIEMLACYVAFFKHETSSVLRAFLNQTPGSNPAVSQALVSDTTPVNSRDEGLQLQTVYTLRNGQLDRTDHSLKNDKQYSCRIGNDQVEFFAGYVDDEYSNRPTIFFLESEKDKEDPGAEGKTALIRHLHASQFEFDYIDVDSNSFTYKAWQTDVDLDVTVPASSFQVQKINGAIYLYWLETAQKEKDTDPDIYQLRGVVYDLVNMVASDDFVLAQFTDTTGGRPAHVFLGSDGKGYYTRWTGKEGENTATVLSFPFRTVAHADLRGMTCEQNVVHAGTDLDMNISVVNDGNMNIDALDLEVVLTDDDGNVIKNPDGTDMIVETLHADFVNPEKSTRTVNGDASSDTKGAHAIYRTDEPAQEPVQSRFNVSEHIWYYQGYVIGYNPYDMGTKTTAHTSPYLLPAQKISLVAAVHIPADWKDTKHITLRLASPRQTASNQSGLATPASDHSILLNHNIHDLDMDHRLYTGPGGEEYLAITIYNHSETGENLCLTANMVLDDDPVPIPINLPYTPEYTASGMTHTITMPVSALLNGRKANKVEIELTAGGITESSRINNRIIFHPSALNPLVIIEQPTNITVKERESARFSVTAAGGTAPYAYQWQIYKGEKLGWQDLNGETDATLTILKTQVSQTGSLYRCVVTDRAMNRVESGSALLTVQKDVPQTGDRENILLDLLMIILPLLAAAIFLRKNRRTY